MGRLSAYAKNRILKLRFKKNKRIIHIVDILKNDDNIKVSRQAVSTFLKKYLETNSIYDKPRTGRKRKLTPEEIQLIGQVTRLNRDITARAIKEYLNLNVSTYTILRATKLFEWNKINPNSNDSKKAAAIERQLNGSDLGEPASNSGTEGPIVSGRQYRSSSQDGRKKYKQRKSTANDSQNVNNENSEKAEDQLDNSTNNSLVNSNTSLKDDTCGEITNEIEKIQNVKMLSHLTSENDSNSQSTTPKTTVHKNSANYDLEKIDLNLIPHKELAILKNLSCSPMSFATKILFKIFKIEELHGHNVSGKTLNKNLKAKLPLDPVRIGYIKFLVEKYYDEKECKEMLSGATSHKQDLWKSCHTAINKSILISERKAAAAAAAGLPLDTNLNNDLDTHLSCDKNGKKNTDRGEKHSDSDDDDELDEEVIKKIENSKKRSKNSAQKRVRRFKSDDTISSMSLSSSRSDSSSSEFDEDFSSEDIDSDDAENAENESVMETFKLPMERGHTSIKLEFDEDQMEQQIERRRSQRSKKPTYKLAHLNNSNVDGDGDVDNEEDDNGDDYANEIELIQNIENRLLNASSGSANKTKINKKTSKDGKNDAKEQEKENNSIKTDDKTENECLNDQEDDDNGQSCEADAAANIAAAMKKRFVVVAAQPTPSTSVSNANRQKKNTNPINSRTSRLSRNSPNNSKNLIKSPNSTKDGINGKEPYPTSVLLQVKTEPELPVESKIVTRNTKTKKTIDNSATPSQSSSDQRRITRSRVQKT